MAKEEQEYGKVGQDKVKLNEKDAKPDLDGVVRLTDAGGWCWLVTPAEHNALMQSPKSRTNAQEGHGKMARRQVVTNARPLR